MLGILAAVDSSLLDLLTLNGYLGSTAEFWLWSTVLLLIAEVFTTGFFLGALAICTLLTAGGAPWFSPGWQIAFFAASAIGSLLWVRPVFVNLLSPKETPTNTAALTGQVGTVVAQVPAGGHGRVRLANEEWRATSNTELNVGDQVTVSKVAGSTLTVDQA
jgi:membrane protein implicated in regulation of membrane protease activity